MKVNSMSNNAHFAKADEYASENRHQEAVDEFEMALKSNPDHADTYRRMATSLSALGRHDEAHTALQQAVQLQPDNPIMVHEFSDNLERNGSYHEALKFLKDYTARSSDFGYHPYHMMGRILGKLGNISESYENYVKGARLNPPSKNKENYAHMQFRYLQFKYVHNRAKKRDPNNPVSFYNLAQDLFDIDSSSAVDILETATNLMPNADAYLMMGEIYRKGSSHVHCRKLLQEGSRRIQRRSTTNTAIRQNIRRVGRIFIRMWAQKRDVNIYKRSQRHECIK